MINFLIYLPFLNVFYTYKKQEILRILQDGMLTHDAKEDFLEEKYNNVPICIAKTQYSLSDDPKNLDPKKDYNIHVTDLVLKSGAEFIVVLTGDIMTMPGLPKVPNSENIDIIDDVTIGIF